MKDMQVRVCIKGHAGARWRTVWMGGRCACTVGAAACVCISVAGTGYLCSWHASSWLP